MVQNSTGVCESVSDVLLLKGADDHFVYSEDNNLLERLVSAIILIEQ